MMTLLFHDDIVIVTRVWLDNILMFHYIHLAVSKYYCITFSPGYKYLFTYCLYI